MAIKQATIPKIHIFEDEEVSVLSRDTLQSNDSKWYIRPEHVHDQLAELEIYPRVFLGSQWEAKDASWFARHNITHVLNVSSIQNTFQKKPYEVIQDHHHDLKDTENVNPNIMADTGKNKQQEKKKTKLVTVTYLKVNVDDSTDVKISKHFEKATDFIYKALQESPNNHVLVHW